MNWVKDTKNTHVYASVEEAAPVTQLYVQKSAFNGDATPKVITVTIEAEDA